MLKDKLSTAMSIVRQGGIVISTNAGLIDTFHRLTEQGIVKICLTKQYILIN